MSVTLLEEEVVLRGGAGTVSWLVQHNDGWVRAPSHPSAEVEMLDRGGGVVWRRRVTLALAPGTALTRVETRPDSRPKSALEHLTGGARGASRKTRRTSYTVSERGEAVADEK